MKTIVKELRQKSVQEILKEINKLRQEIAKLRLENKTNPSKDTNLLFKKRKKLAIMLTILKEKEDWELINKNKS